MTQSYNFYVYIITHKLFTYRTQGPKRVHSPNSFFEVKICFEQLFNRFLSASLKFVTQFFLKFKIFQLFLIEFLCLTKNIDIYIVQNKKFIFIIKLFQPLHFILCYISKDLNDKIFGSEFGKKYFNKIASLTSSIKGLRISSIVYSSRKFNK